MNEIELRSAEEGDAEAIAGLLLQLGYETTTSEALRRIQRVSSGATDALWVAIDGQGLAGVIQIGETGTIEHEPRAEIRALVVDERRRGAGIGRRLVETAEEWAAGRGLGTVRVRSNVKRERARAFYERNGYAVVKTQNVFDKRLPGDRGR